MDMLKWAQTLSDDELQFVFDAIVDSLRQHGLLKEEPKRSLSDKQLEQLRTTLESKPLPPGVRNAFDGFFAATRAERDSLIQLCRSRAKLHPLNGATPADSRSVDSR